MTSQTALAIAALLCVFLAHACVSDPPVRPSHDPLRVQTPNSVVVALSWIQEPQEMTVEGPVKLITNEPTVLGRHGQTLALPLSRTGNVMVVGRSSYPGPRLALVPQSGWFKIKAIGPDGKPRTARYRGSLILTLSENRWVAANEVEIEDYMKGVVGKEMSLSRTPYEALKAQVIAARTYALYEVLYGRHRQAGQPFDLFDDERSQMYGGMDAENSTALQVVEETRGLVVMYQGQLVQTVYSSTCGGATEPAWEVLSTPQKIAPLGGVACEHCRPSPHFEWRSTIKKAELCEKLTGKKGVIESVDVAKMAKGGHAILVRYQVAGEAKPRIVDATWGFRLKAGARIIKSNFLVEIKDAGDAFEFTGRGWGHAAGMCQYGAWEMAKGNRTAFDILLFYYPQSSIEKIH
jgi:stage II sporulation protein D